MQKGHFYTVYGDFGIFPYLEILLDLGRSKSAQGHLWVLDENLTKPKIRSVPTKPKIINMTFSTSWPWMILTWQKVTKYLETYFEVSYPYPCRLIGVVSIRSGRFPQRLQIVKNPTFDPTCDVISDLQIHFATYLQISSPGFSNSAFGSIIDSVV